MTGHLLRAGFTVVGVDFLNYGRQSAHAVLQYLGEPGFEFHELDVAGQWRDVESLAGKADVVIPLAALVGAPLCEEHQDAARDVNERAVRSLANSLSPSQRLLYPNTNSGYGRTDGESACTEESPLAPISVYGQTKCAAEAAVLDHPNAVSLRLATVFGVSPRMRLDLMVNDFTNRLRVVKKKRGWVECSGVKAYTDRELALEVYEPDFMRNFVGVRDVANAFLFMADNHHLKGAFNLGLPTANLTKLELAHKVCDTLGLSREAVCVGEGTDPDKRNYLVSNDKILRAGFAFGHTLEDGIREVARACDLFQPGDLKEMRNA